MTYRPELDGVRCTAIVAVFIAHLFQAAGVPLAPPQVFTVTEAMWWYRGLALSGAFGVDLFFALSGFLITTLLLREEQQRGRIDLGSFWIRRALRIWPAYYALILAMILFNESSPGTRLAFLTFTANAPLFTTALETRGPIDMGALWSIQIEEQFYVVWPLLLVLTGRRWRLAVTVAIIAASVGYRAWAFAHGSPLTVWGVRMDGLGVGALMAMRPLGDAPRWVRWVAAAAPLIAVTAAGFASQSLRPTDADLAIRSGWGPVVTIVPMLVALTCGCVVWSAARARWLRWRPVVHVGRISYGLYLVHGTVIGALAFVGWPWRAATSLLAAIVIADLSYRLMERPFLRLKERFTRVRSVSVAPGPRPHHSTSF